MPRILAPSAACLALILLAPAAAGARGGAGARASHGPHVSGALEACHAGTLPTDRYAAFSGQMMTVTRASAMAMRFDLLGQVPGTAGTKRLAAPGLGVWQRSAPRIAIFRYRQEVTNLPAVGSFRAQVSYRWYDASGRVIRRAWRRTLACQIPDLRPHLTVGQILMHPALDGRSTAYQVVVRNDGLGIAAGFAVTLAVNGASQPGQTIDSLPAEEQRALTFTGPPCAAGGTVRVSADPDGRLDQTNRAYAVNTLSC